MKGNPFTLTFGKQPGEYINRYENTETIISTFNSDNPVSQAYLIEGIRGSGKTVLMTSITKELSHDKSWIIVDLNSTNDLIEDLAIRLSESCKKIPEIIKSGFGISLAGFGVSLNGSQNTADNISIINSILSAAAKKKKKILITIDEAMHNNNMRHFASEFQLLLRKDFPVFLLMTGLYENIYAIQNDPALTFLLRTPKIIIEPLSIRRITNQYARIFEINENEAKTLANITKGYAFAFQALGLLYYEYRNDLKMEDILEKFDDMLDDFVYRKIWESLSPVDRTVILAVTEESTKVKDICEKLSMSSSNFSKYRDRLIKRGLMISANHGYVSLTLPRFLEVAKGYV